MKTKREVVALVPYRNAAAGLEFFLQQREMSSHPNAGLLDLFGGGVENGETLEEALLREIQEELEYTPRAYPYFSKYENATHVCNIFIEEVGQAFEDQIRIHEGKYGRFLTLSEARQSEIFEQTLMALKQITSYFARK